MAGVMAAEVMAVSFEQRKRRVRNELPFRYRNELPCRYRESG